MASLAVKTQAPGKVSIAAMLLGECSSVALEALAAPELHSDFLQACADEGVAALLAHQLRESGQLLALPVALQELLREQEREAVAIDLRRQHELRAVLESFGKAGIPSILLKGGALANSLYPESYLRSRCDSDLLLRDRTAAESAWSILEARGYRRECTISGQFVGYGYACSRTLASGMVLNFDIHTQISDYVWFVQRFPAADLFANTVPGNCAGYAVRILSRPYALMHACLHRISNKPSGIEDRLVWLFDIHLLCRALTAQEWQLLLEVADSRGMARTCLEGMRRARDFLATAIPVAVEERLEELAASQPAGLGNASGRAGLYLRDFLSNRGLGNKLRQAADHLLPPASYMQEKYAVRSRWLLPFYYIRRALAGVLKYLR